MIGTITLNPCIDKTLMIEGFTYGGMNRVNQKRADVSGKGINVSIALTQLGMPVKTFGINYKEGSQTLREELQKNGIDYQAVLVDGVLRENIKVMDMKTCITTELNQKGDYVSEEKLLEFGRMIDNNLGDLEILVVTGSVPQGVNKEYYKQLIEKANAKGVKVILDAEGEFLLKGMEGKPYLIKPNLYEFETAFGMEGKGIKEVLQICRKIIEDGIKVVCVSMGDEGALIADKDEAYICRPTELDIKGTQGAGDSLVAGICIAMEHGLPISEMLRYGVATAQGSLIREGTQLCTKEDFEIYQKLLTIEKIEN